MNVQQIRPPDSKSKNPSKANPLLEGFKLVTTELEMFKLICRDPFRNAAWRKDNQDIDLFRYYLQQVVVPTRYALKVGVAIHKALKISLHQQNPDIQENQRQYLSTGESLLKPEYYRGIHDGICLIGVTGLGKSHLIKASLASIPQCIERKDLHGLEQVTQINWLYIDMSSIASVEALARRLVEEVDRVLESKGKLLDVTFKGLNSATAKMQAAIRILKTHYCGILVFDEIQQANFAVATAAPLRDWMLRIANVGIGLVFSGNPLGFKLQMPKTKKKEEEVQQYFTQFMRRLFSSENIRLDPAPKFDDKDWLFFTKAIITCRLFGKAHVYVPELELRKFQLTGGFHDFYVELHCSIEKLLAKNPRLKVDINLIELAAKQSAKLTEMKSLISAISNRDSIALRLCVDVDFEYYQELWFQESKGDGSSQPIGPVGVVLMPTKTIDVTKSLADDKNTAKRRIEKNKAKAEKISNPAAQAVRENHLDELEKLISGKTKKSPNG